MCAPGPGGTGKCIGTRPFAGPNCTDDDGCLGGFKCYWYSPFVADQRHGECRLPCDENLQCPARAGIPHICLDGGNGGCYPSGFGLPCADTSDCLSAFTCQVVAPDERSKISSPAICTIACENDSDCTSDVAINSHGGFCRDGFCRPTGQDGVACDRDAQCLSGRCLLNGDGGTGTCAPT